MNQRNQQAKPRKSSSAKKGLATTTAIAAAAGLLGATLIYLRHRGVRPKDEAKKFGARAKSASAVLKGEGRAAYKEIRQAVIDELAMTQPPITKASVRRIIGRITTSLKKHGTVTGTELKLIGEQLKTDWQSLRRAATKQQEMDQS